MKTEDLLNTSYLLVTVDVESVIENLRLWNMLFLFYQGHTMNAKN